MCRLRISITDDTIEKFCFTGSAFSLDYQQRWGRLVSPQYTMNIKGNAVEDITLMGVQRGYRFAYRRSARHFQSWHGTIRWFQKSGARVPDINSYVLHFFVCVHLFTLRVEGVSDVLWSHKGTALDRQTFLQNSSLPIGKMASFFRSRISLYSFYHSTHFTGLLQKRSENSSPQGRKKRHSE